ncbi:hypothetical protein KZZ52_36545 [Dactylosporangium sp. AC04546]|uniref:hypothetical protein n=1 Tax=Dactylosporangium sp. AC04546 TaxID=2862460 RepID=UPI001EDFE8B2|nr:hypothetical protein [Dactylosporangium sp. AC04546]WVK79476.1 hypothetical protein KZZ52_36545 [Dactylosporangium sp. AC04546]
MPITLEIVAEPSVAEFRSLPDNAGRMGAIRVAREDLSTLADYLDRRFELPGTGTVEERLTAAIQAMADRGEIQTRYRSNHDHIATYCERAGVAYNRRWFDTRRWSPTERRTPLFRTAEPNGFLRTMSLLLYPFGGDGINHSRLGVSLQEDFSDPAASYPDDVYTAYSYDLSIAYESFGPLADLLEERFALRSEGHIEERAEAIFTGLVERGELGSHLPPGDNRERLAGWCREVDIRPTWGGHNRRHEILRAEQLGKADGLVLEVSFWPAFWPPPVIRFTEAYRVGDLRHGGTQYEVTAPFESMPVLVEEFERRLRLTPAPGRTDDRLVACFDALAEQGHLSAGLPRQGNRAVVAEWITAAGVTPTLRGFARTERLLQVHRTSTDCMYELTLTMDSAARDGGVSFSEKYDYLPRSGDAGREYAYGVSTSYASMAALVAYFETEPGEGDLEERLTRCFKALVERGDLTAELGLRAARDRVTAWFTQAGVAVKPSDWAWINSD